MIRFNGSDVNTNIIAEQLTEFMAGKDFGFNDSDVYIWGALEGRKRQIYLSTRIPNLQGLMWFLMGKGYSVAMKVDGGHQYSIGVRYGERYPVVKPEIIKALKIVLLHIGAKVQYREEDLVRRNLENIEDEGAVSQPANSSGENSPIIGIVESVNPENAQEVVMRLGTPSATVSPNGWRPSQLIVDEATGIRYLEPVESRQELENNSIVHRFGSRTRRGLYYDVNVTPNLNEQGGVDMVCNCPGYRFHNRQCVHINSVRYAMNQVRRSPSAAPSSSNSRATDSGN